MELVENMLCGAEQSLSRLITLVERDAPDVPQIMKKILPRTGRAYCIGITGPPGSGKSTLVDRLTAIARCKGLSVGIIAVDPTSPFSGGAVLGDRIRMQQHYLDDGVFIRSMATRGSLGGLPRAARAVIKLLDAFGKDLIIVETVGVGQTELDIMKMVDTTVVVLFPGGGDAIQTMKAGLMEIANIFVVNKADREGADRLVTELSMMLDLNPLASPWRPPIIKTIATMGEGIAELTQKILEHRQFLEKGKGLQRKRNERARGEIINLIEHEISKYIHKMLKYDLSFDQVIDQVVARKKDPYSYAQKITEPFAKYYQIYKVDKPKN